MKNYDICIRMWISGPKGTFLGEGRISLLKNIQKHGSISKAARSMKMSYKKAWELTDAINKEADQKVVELVTGGIGGGGARLTDYGLRVIENFEDLNKRCLDFLEKEKKSLKF